MRTSGRAMISSRAELEIGGINHVGNRADDGHCLAPAAALDQGVETVLRSKAVRHPPVGRQQPRTRNGPTERGRVLLHQRMRVPRHVRPMESTQPEMHDTSPALRQIVVGNCDGWWQIANGSGAQRNGHVALLYVASLLLRAAHAQGIARVETSPSVRSLPLSPSHKGLQGGTSFVTRAVSFKAGPPPPAGGQRAMTLGTPSWKRRSSSWILTRRHQPATARPGPASPCLASRMPPC